MKPSEIIEKLGMYNIEGTGPLQTQQFNPYLAFKSLLQYLDEQWEKEQCKHENLLDRNTTAGDKVCARCSKNLGPNDR